MAKVVEMINYGHWYYDHGSTMMPVMTTEDGRREYHDRLLARGYEVLIRNATADEHAAMVEEFDRLVDKLASEGFVAGIGNFEKDSPPPNLAEAVADLKARARIEPRTRL